MKGEMGKSLIYSWLRHIRGCNLVEVNYRTSPFWHINKGDEAKEILKALEDGMEEVKTLNIKNIYEEIKEFKIDVFGSKFVPLSDNENFAVNICFDDLNDELTKEEVVQKYIGKYLNMFFTMYCYLGITKANITIVLFNINYDQEILEATEKLGEIINSYSFDTEFNFELISNEDLNNEILEPVYHIVSSLEGTGEIFAESINLYRIFRDSISKEISKENVEIKIDPHSLRNFLEKVIASDKHMLK